MPLVNASSTPVEPASTPRPGVARSATVPSKLVGSANRGSSPASTGPSDCETLFVHPTVKVVKFDAKPTGASRPSLSPGRGDARNDVGTLPWSTPTEMTVAAGPLSIYRVPSSGVMVSFLKSGSLLHPILVRAPSWCVDGKSKFVLRTPGLFYYRIELPNETDEDKAHSEQFKIVLAKISKYEKTPCPFRRGFHVEIEQEPEAAGPSKANKWKTSEKAKRWTLDSSVWEREDGRRLSENVASPDLSAIRRLPEEDDDSTYGASEDGSTSPHDLEGHPLPSPTLAIFPKSVEQPKRTLHANSREHLNVEKETMPAEPVVSVSSDEISAFKAEKERMKAEPVMSNSPDKRPALNVEKEVVPAEPVLSMSSDKRPALNVEKEVMPAEAVLSTSSDKRPALPREESTASSISSFYSVAETVTELESTILSQQPQRSLSPLPIQKPQLGQSSGSSPVLQTGISEHSIESYRGLADQAAGTTVPSKSNELRNSFAQVDSLQRPRSRRAASTPSTFALSSDSDSIRDISRPATPENLPRPRLPRNASHRRAFSPRPRTNSLILSGNSSPQKQLSTELLHKTYDILMSPPAHLVALMLRIAARVVRRAQDWTVFETKGKRRVPGTWESSSEDEAGSDDDDFGMPLRPVRSRSSIASFRTTSSARGRSVSRYSDGVD